MPAKHPLIFYADNMWQIAWNSGIFSIEGQLWRSGGGPAENREDSAQEWSDGDRDDSEGSQLDDEEI